MISYWKTQWFNIVVGCVYLGISIYNFCIGDTLWGIAWTLPAIVWFIMSHINYNDDRVKLLEKEKILTAAPARSSAPRYPQG